MTSKKRQRRDRLRPPAPRPVAQSTVVDLVIPPSGPATFRDGWGISWSAFRAQLRRPFTLVLLFIATFLVFSFIKMLLAYVVTLVGWGAETPDPGVTQALNTALWQIFGFLVAPAAMTPWLAARVVFANGIRPSWRLVTEPMQVPWRWAHLLVLGSVWVVLAGVVGAYTPELAQWAGWRPIVLALILLWVVTQVVFSVATAAVWRDGEPAHRALGIGLIRPIRGAVPLLGVLLAWFVQATVTLGLVLGTLALPLWYMGVEPGQAKVAGLLFLPVLAVLAPFWPHQRAVMALALLDWGAAKDKEAIPAPAADSTLS